MAYYGCLPPKPPFLLLVSFCITLLWNILFLSHTGRTHNPVTTLQFIEQKALNLSMGSCFGKWRFTPNFGWKIVLFCSVQLGYLLSVINYSWCCDMFSDPAFVSVFICRLWIVMLQFPCYQLGD